MTIHLTLEQEQRVQAVIGAGTYKSLDQLVEAALTALEQCPESGIPLIPANLEALLMDGLHSPVLTEEDFWNSVDARTAILLAEHGPRQPS